MPVLTPTPTAPRLAGVPRRQCLSLVGASLLGLGLVGCASKPVTSTVGLTLAASADVNPDPRGRASPLTVRVYALKLSTGFDAADFFSLYDKDSATLGADMLQREEFLLRPGENKTLALTLPAEAGALAVFAAYRDLEHARWRAVRQVEVGKAVQWRVKLGQRQVSFE